MKNWINFHGMVTVEQAEYLIGVLAAGNDPAVLAGSCHERDLVANVEDQLRKAVGHIKEQGCSGSGIVVEGNRFAESEA